MLFNIEILKKDTNLFVKQVSIRRKDHIHLLDEVCTLIDKKKLALFNFIIDTKQSNGDFSYDFSPLSYEICSVIEYLSKPFTLEHARMDILFYERYLKVEMLRDDIDVYYTIYDISDGQKLYSYSLPILEANNNLVTIMHSFKEVMSIYFPNVLEFFIKEEFIFYGKCKDLI